MIGSVLANHLSAKKNERKNLLTDREQHRRKKIFLRFFETTTKQRTKESMASNSDEDSNSAFDLSLDAAANFESGLSEDGEEEESWDESDDFDSADSTPQTPPISELFHLQDRVDEMALSPDDVRTAASSSSTSASGLPDNPHFQLVELLSVPETVISISFDDSQSFEQSDWKTEFRIIAEKVRNACGSDVSIPTYSQLIRVLYEQIANFLVNPRYNIFEGASPNDKFLQFGKFTATLNILQVSRLSFAELENPVFSPYFSALALPLSLTSFQTILKKLSEAIFTSKGAFLKQMEAIFTEINMCLFYHPSFGIGADDDKQPTRSESLSGFSNC